MNNALSSAPNVAGGCRGRFQRKWDHPILMEWGSM